MPRSPARGIIDSQSVKGADTVGRDSRGYDAGKKINGRKRFIVTDTPGVLIVVIVLAASVQDRDGAKPPSCTCTWHRRSGSSSPTAASPASSSSGQPSSCAPPCTSCGNPKASKASR
ncbi:transposase [Dactylosporangium sp. NPDC050588]|uniref:transposase n=1 Tax=Dactylosporangium sp. NPDC050588 TaxID=3157211 RepID=UPI0033CD5D21